MKKNNFRIVLTGIFFMLLLGACFFSTYLHYEDANDYLTEQNYLHLQTTAKSRATNVIIYLQGQTQLTAQLALQIHPLEQRQYLGQIHLPLCLKPQ